MPRRAALQSCECGCGDWTNGGRFLPGHDARLRGDLLRAMRNAGGFVRGRWTGSADATEELNRRHWLPNQHGSATRQERVRRISASARVDYGPRDVTVEMTDWTPTQRAMIDWAEGSRRSEDIVADAAADVALDRTFGVELEFFGTTPERVVAEFTARGLVCHFEGYNHNTRPHWKIVTDVSVNSAGTSSTSRNGRGTGLELVSPILRGEAGFASLQTACEALTAAGAKVDRTCGVHVHHGTDGLDAMAVARIAANYSYGQQFIDQLLPPSRRSTARNMYCMPRDSRNVEGLIRAATSCRTAREMAYHGGSRYHTVNLESLTRHTTVEFRQHSGSTEYAKIGTWVRLGQAIIAKSRETIITSAESLEAWAQAIGCDDDLVAALTERAAQVARSEERRRERTLVGAGAR